MKIFSILKEEFNNLVDNSEEIDDENLENLIILKQKSSLLNSILYTMNNLKLYNIEENILKEKFIKEFRSKGIFMLIIFTDFFNNILEFEDIDKKISLINLFLKSFKSIYLNIWENNNFDQNINNLINFCFFKNEKKLKIINMNYNVVMINDIILDLNDNKISETLFKKIINCYIIENLPILNFDVIVVIKNLLNILSELIKFILNSNLIEYDNDIKYSIFYYLNNFIYEEFTCNILKNFKLIDIDFLLNDLYKHTKLINKGKQEKELEWFYSFEEGINLWNKN